MYLVVADHGNSSLMMVLWGWASGKEGYRDMRRFIVEKLGPGTYVFREDDEVTKALYNIQWKYGKDKSGKCLLRVLRVAESDVDLLKEIELINQREVVPVSDEQSSPQKLSKIEASILEARKQFEALPDIGLDKRRKVYEWFFNLGDPAKCIRNQENIEYTLKLKPGIVFDLLNYLVNDPRVRVELRKMGFVDEELPDWVARAPG